MCELTFIWSELKSILFFLLKKKKAKYCRNSSKCHSDFQLGLPTAGKMLPCHVGKSSRLSPSCYQDSGLVRTVGTVFWDPENIKNRWDRILLSSECTG
jgi:hypothetical protein